MKICVLCGAPPNVHDGVGDFAWLLAEELSTRSAVSLIVSAPYDVAQDRDSGLVKIYRVDSRWGRRSSKETLDFVKRIQPEVVLVHFVPQLYGWNGAKPFLTLLLLRLKRMGYPIVTVAHEFSAPFGPSPQQMFWATIHQPLLRLIVAASSKIVTTTLFCRRLFQRRFPSRESDVHQIPVSSTVPAVAIREAQRQALRFQMGIAPDDLVVSTFGSVIGGTTDDLEKLFRWLVREIGSVRLLVIGKAGEAVHRRMSRASSLLRRVTITGPISQAEVSKYLSLSDLYVALYPDGASTRRTSLLIGFAHGLPTVSNSGVLTDSLLASSGALHFMNDLTDEQGKAVLRDLCQDTERRRELGHRGRAFYENHFSWESVGAQYHQVLYEALTA